MSDEMILVERQLIKRTDKRFKEIDDLSFKSKNLYNAALYRVRQYYFENKAYLSKFDLITIFIKENQVDYRALPAKVSNYVLFRLDKNFKSFFALLKERKNKNYNKKVHLPKYLDKLKGRYVLEYHKQALKLKKPGKVTLSKSDLTFLTKVPNDEIQFLRIVPKIDYYMVEIGYKKQCKEKVVNKNKRYAFVDPGMNNLFTVTSNVFNPYIINGRPIKSMNHYYNKKKTKIQAELKKKNNLDWSYRLSQLTLKRKNKINDYKHKATSKLVNQLVSNRIDTLIIGKNVEMKQDINLGKKTNQNFVYIPLAEIIDVLVYKCKLEGIEVILTEESHTSKCSFIDKEEIKHQNKYVGRRVRRGLFKTKDGYKINADVNGSLNIGRKYLAKINEYTKELHNQLILNMNNPKIINL